MIYPLKLLLLSQLKRSKLTHKPGGFTLIELLVAMILATLVIAPLLGFMVNIMDSDRQEQAKATSEQEIQSALDFIAQDLKQAVYIYDASGLDNNSTTNPTTSGIKDQIPPLASATGCGSTTTCVPVLVFWKREIRQGVIPVIDSTAKNDTFVYSLVAYYLIKNGNANPTWSDVARIGRFKIRDGVINPNTPTNDDGSPNYVSTVEKPSNGFQLFELSGSGISLKDKMNSWKKKTGENTDYTDQPSTLIDFVDQSTNEIPVSCPTNAQQVPSTLFGGFYACVDSSKTSAQIYIRGNALARLKKGTTYSANKSIYFPTASLQIKEPGFLGIN